ncbi:hypothetical protein HK102_011810, partial [Quaeritorhiza haematococci]
MQQPTTVYASHSLPTAHQQQHLQQNHNHHHQQPQSHHNHHHHHHRSPSSSFTPPASTLTPSSSSSSSATSSQQSTQQNQQAGTGLKSAVSTVSPSTQQQQAQQPQAMKMSASVSTTPNSPAIVPNAANSHGSHSSAITNGHVVVAPQPATQATGPSPTPPPLPSSTPSSSSSMNSLPQIQLSSTAAAAAAHQQQQYYHQPHHQQHQTPFKFSTLEYAEKIKEEFLMMEAKLEQALDEKVEIYAQYVKYAETAYQLNSELTRKMDINSRYQAIINQVLHMLPPTVQGGVRQDMEVIKQLSES